MTAMDRQTDERQIQTGEADTRGDKGMEEDIKRCSHFSKGPWVPRMVGQPLFFLYPIQGSQSCGVASAADNLEVPAVVPIWHSHLRAANLVQDLGFCGS